MYPRSLYAGNTTHTSQRGFIGSAILSSAGGRLSERNSEIFLSRDSALISADSLGKGGKICFTCSGLDINFIILILLLPYLPQCTTCLEFFQLLSTIFSFGSQFPALFFLVRLEIHYRLISDSEIWGHGFGVSHYSFYMGSELRISALFNETGGAGRS